jgi:hypothetical protein
MSGLRMKLAPSASEAIATARIVCDLDAGMVTDPFSRDFLTINCIVGDILTEVVSLVVAKK